MTARSALLWTTTLAVALVALPLRFSWLPRVIWNASASVPIGLYTMRPVGHVAVGDLVAVAPLDPLAVFLAERGYLPLGVLLIKRVLALPGTEVCRTGLEIIAYDLSYGTALAQDRLGRDLPSWQGCHVLAEGEVFLMNWDTPDSLDGRYFGPLPLSTITAQLSPLWTDEEGNGDFEWRAGAPLSPANPATDLSRKERPHATDR
ncbi:S26 family signal peptidase [Pseudooceanicola lipolyticus]|uniref:S26 family signal peptidase n=1 Tax=Pseudooceanicola lipolyticus TaxID=2029104 RepID=A0A2M8J476_9RHOB|nr:S26 family signal peptidase [Pseudooceanicola lipolyticus]MCC0027241.1 S26 family signal peptidase [Brucellaceae bacterium]PJE37570.1 S26 family signal peptidase [Pseudooceanicola lipolyticus]